MPIIYFGPSNLNRACSILLYLAELSAFFTLNVITTQPFPSSRIYISRSIHCCLKTFVGSLIFCNFLCVFQELFLTYHWNFDGTQLENREVISCSKLGQVIGAERLPLILDNCLIGTTPGVRINSLTWPLDTMYFFSASVYIVHVTVLVSRPLFCFADCVFWP